MFFHPKKTYMKTFTLLKINVLSQFNKFKFLTLMYFFTICALFQFNLTQAQTGPGLHWNKDHWYGMDDNVAQEDSGEDWYYGISPYEDEDVLIGYVAAGYSSILNDFGDFDCVDCEEFAYECKELESELFQRGCIYPKIAEMDKNGNVEWYEIYTRAPGWFRQVIQLADESGYIAVGHLKYDGGENPGDLVYKQGVDLSEYLPLCATNPYELLYVVRTDMEGVIQEEAVYGLGTVENATAQKSQAYGIIQDDDGELIVIGYAYDDIDIKRGYVLKLDETTLDVIYEEVLFESDAYESHSTCLIELAENYYVFSTKYTAAIPDLYGHIFINKLDNSLETESIFEITSTQEPDLDGLDDYCSSVAFDVIVDDGDLVAAVQVNRTNGVQSTNDEALVRVYRIHPGTSPAWTFEQNLSIVDNEETEIFRAYDLKVGITNTSDGGFAVTSTMHDSDLFETNEDDYAYYEDCDLITAGNQPCVCDLDYEWTKSWNGDPYVAKFDDSDDLEWRNAYTVADAYGPYYPEDVKRLECVYEIIQDDDGGYILAGNNSKNFDDDFVYRIFDDCNIYTTYTGTYDLVDPSPISSAVTWSNNAKVKGVVTINSGGTLTINNGAIIQFADTKANNHPTYIRVKRGGRLIIEGGAKLTGNTTCGTMWEGIYVEGTSGTNHPTPSAFIAASYTNTDHGFIWVKGDAIIENARTAISLGLPRKFLPPVSGTWSGGIIIADDAHFLNNATDISFYPFTKVNRSLIRNSEFLTNAALLDVNEIPLAHIDLKLVKGVNIRGNYFENSVSEVIYNGTDRGAAVNGTDAAFKFNDNPNAFGATGGTGSAPNTVIDMHYGIYATQFTVAADNIVIDANIFEDNARSIYLGGTELAEVNLNTITMPSKSNYALYLDASTDYGVEANTVTGAGATNVISQSGIIINDNGTSNNRIYRNSFSDIVYGIKAQNTNGNSTSGILFKCNTFNDNKYDIAVTSGAIKEDQGECIFEDETTPAGNIFTDNLTTSTLQFAANSGVGAITYHHHNDGSSATAPFYEPYEFSSSIITLDECNESYSSTNSCPSDFTDGGGSRLAAPNQKGAMNYGVTTKELFDSLSQFQKDILRNEIIRNYFAFEDLEGVLSFLSEDSSLRSTTLQAIISIDSNEYSNIGEYLELMNANPETEAQGVSQEIYEIVSELKQDTLNWFDLDSDQLEAINYLSNENGRIGVIGKLILKAISGISYNEPIEEIENELEFKLAEEKTNKAIGHPTIQIFPHPVGKQSVIAITIPDNIVNAQFNIYNLQGQELMHYELQQSANHIIVSNEMLFAGLYLGIISANNIIMESIKFVVNE